MPGLWPKNLDGPRARIVAQSRESAVAARPGARPVCRSLSGSPAPSARAGGPRIAPGSVPRSGPGLYCPPGNIGLPPRSPEARPALLGAAGNARPPRPCGSLQPGRWGRASGFLLPSGLVVVTRRSPARPAPRPAWGLPRGREPNRAVARPSAAHFSGFPRPLRGRPALSPFCNPCLRFIGGPARPSHPPPRAARGLP